MDGLYGCFFPLLCLLGLAPKNMRLLMRFLTKLYKGKFLDKRAFF